MLYLLAKVLLSPFFLLLMRPRVRGCGTCGGAAARSW